MQRFFGKQLFPQFNFLNNSYKKVSKTDIPLIFEKYCRFFKFQNENNSTVIALI